MRLSNPFLITVFIFLTAQLAYSQITFERYYDFGTNGDVEQAYCVEATADGGYVMCGRQGQLGQTLLLLLKVDSTGIEQWHKTYDFGAGWTVGYAVKQTPDLGYVITGTCADALAYYVFVAKCDQNGDTLWSKKCDPWAEGVRVGVNIVFNDSGFTVLANSVYQVDSLYSAQLFFTNALGNLVDQKIFTRGSGISPCGFTTTADGGFAIATYTNPSSNDNDIYLVKTDAAGDTVWTKTIAHPPGYRYVLHYSNCINETSNGGFIITGTAINSSVNPSKRLLLIRTDEYGDTLWTRQIVGLDDLWGDGGGVATPDGAYVVAGTNEYDGNFYLAKTDAQGTVQWQQSYGGVYHELANYLIATLDNGFAVCGMEMSWGDNGGVYLIKTDSVGYALSYITSVNIHQTVSGSVALYPNPFTDKATVSINLNQHESGSFTLYNSVGQCVRTFAVVDSVFTLKRESLPAGLYVGVFTTSDRRRSSRIEFVIL